MDIQYCFVQIYRTLVVKVTLAAPPKNLWVFLFTIVLEITVGCGRSLPCRSSIYSRLRLVIEKHYLFDMSMSAPYAPWCWNIYQHLPSENVGKYTSTEENLGSINLRIHYMQLIHQKPLLVALAWKQLLSSPPLALAELEHWAMSLVIQPWNTGKSLWNHLQTCLFSVPKHMQCVELPRSSQIYIP